jgi:DNA-binding transcriptional MerR regulator/methylmalonyl-CoA mutase cobalamin-binding subunit
MKHSESMYSIAAVEREVGLSKDVLRVWERRYGFPLPSRDARGERLYSSDQVLRLRLVKRLMDGGHRPGRLLALPVDALQSLVEGPVQGTGKAAQAAPPGAAAVDPELLALIGRHDGPGLAQALQQRLAQLGLVAFVLDTIAPLAVQVGEEWARGRMEVFEEHLFTEVAVRLLRQAIAAVPPRNGPVVLLTTVPGEPHGLGLLMVESLLTLQGARCINLGTQLPLQDIARAAKAYRAEVVGLSFSSASSGRRIPEVLGQLRSALDPAVQLWAGGDAMRRVPQVAGVKPLVSLQEAMAAIAA